MPFMRISINNAKLEDDVDCAKISKFRTCGVHVGGQTDTWVWDAPSMIEFMESLLATRSGRMCGKGCIQNPHALCKRATDTSMPGLHAIVDQHPVIIGLRSQPHHANLELAGDEMPEREVVNSTSGYCIGSSPALAPNKSRA